MKRWIWQILFLAALTAFFFTKRGDWLIHLVFLVGIVGLSVVAIVKLFIDAKSGKQLAGAPTQLSALPRSWRRWILDEPDESYKR